jgi:hypothetical protein
LKTVKWLNRFFEKQPVLGNSISAISLMPMLRTSINNNASLVEKRQKKVMKVSVLFAFAPNIPFYPAQTGHKSIIIRHYCIRLLAFSALSL